MNHGGNERDGGVRKVRKRKRLTEGTHGRYF